MGIKSFFARSHEPEIALTITAKTFYKVLLLIVVTIFVLAALKSAEYSLTLIFIAMFLALALNAPVSFVARHLPGPLRGSRSSATALSFLIVVLALGIFVASLVPPIVRQTQSFIDSAPQIVQELQSQNSQVSKFIDKYHLQTELDQISNELSNKLRNSSSAAIGALTGIANSIVSILTILVLTFMMLIEGPSWLMFFRQFVSPRHRDHADMLRRNMYKAIKGFVNGQVVLAVIASFLVLPGLLIFHVSYPIALMAVVFICGLIPMVGHTIGAIIVTFIALFHSPFSALGILIYYILYQQIENYLIQPRLQANVTNLSPLLVMVSLIVGVSFGGLLGGLFAIPVAACLRVWVVDYLQTRYDVDESSLPGNMLKKDV